MPHYTRPLNRQDYKTLTLAALGGALDFMISSSLSSPPLSASYFPGGYPGGCARCRPSAYLRRAIARPLGGIIMAHFGDLVGRKKMFTLSILLMALPTLAIGLLPTRRWASVPLCCYLCVFFRGGDWR